MKPFAIKIGGEAGFGITSAGVMLSKIITRSGYHVFDYMEYPSIIRGGHNVVDCFVAERPVLAPYQHTNLLVALNQETIDRHKSELTPDAIVIYDSERATAVDSLPTGVSTLDIPLARLAKDTALNILARDTVALGAILALLQGDWKILKNMLADEFSAKGAKVIKTNQLAARAGYDYVLQKFPSSIIKILKPRPAQKRLVINANEAIALGAIAAGMQFCSIYPMTPTSNILHVLAPLQKEFGFIYKQPEDEISAINMAIGAAFAGARSMVATAGGGFCLMTEAYGLAGITETPLVIIEGMRPGPATGLPTWTGQADLRFVLHAGQDEFPRLVLAPGDAAEAFYMAMEAFNLAEIYQTPVVIMIDKHLCESHQSFLPFDYKKYKILRGKYTIKKQPSYERYAASSDGISLRIPAGVGAHVIANSDEHTPDGYSSEDAANRISQMQKRLQKLATCAKNSMPAPALYGPANAALTIVAWGSSKGAVLEAIKNRSDVNFLHLTWLNPFPKEAVQKILGQAKKILNIESNFTAQLAGLIREHTGIEIGDSLLKYDGRPIYPEEISEKINALIA